MEKRKVLEICKRVAPAFKLDPLLALAICEQESSYNERAVRFEPLFFKRYVEPGGGPFSVELLMSFSYGLMQTMGLTLEEQGFFTGCELAGDFANTIDGYIIAPDRQVEEGCATLKRKMGVSEDVKLGLLRYNGGGNPNYPNEVLARYAKLQDEFK